MKQLFDFKATPVPFKYVLLVAVAFCLIVVVQSSAITDGDILLDVNRIVLFTINYLTWALMVPLLFQLTVIKADFKDVRFYFHLLMWMLLLAFINLILTNIVFYTFQYLVMPDSFERMLTSFKDVFLRAYFSRILDFVVIFGLLKLVYDYKVFNQQKVKLSGLENQLNLTKLEALKMQLNPHFLFNTLHAVHSLIGHDDSKARMITLKISNLLRKMLEQKNKYLVTLQEELDYLRDYLDIEQERFQDRLTITYHLDPNADSCEVPNLILQPLAENAFKHGISLIEGESYIHISTLLGQDGLLEICMTNSVDPAQVAEVESYGIGLSNLEKRLEQVYGDEYRLNTQKHKNEFKVSIILPTND
ncbi:MAG: histidine kinase [Bacteroidota bacterium]